METRQAHVHPLALPCVHVNTHTEPNCCKRTEPPNSLKQTQARQNNKFQLSRSYTKQALHGNRRNQPHFPYSEPELKTGTRNPTCTRVPLENHVHASFNGRKFCWATGNINSLGSTHGNGSVAFTPDNPLSQKRCFIKFPC